MQKKQPTSLGRRSPYIGLAPGPWLVPGPIQKGRDINTTLAGCFLRSRISASHFPGRRWEGSLIPGYALRDSGTTTIPSSRACPGNYSKRLRYQYNLCRKLPKIPDMRCAIPGRRWEGSLIPGYALRDSGTTTPASSRACPGIYSKRLRYQYNLCRKFPKIPDIRFAIPGRR